MYPLPVETMNAELPGWNVLLVAPSIRSGLVVLIVRVPVPLFLNNKNHLAPSELERGKVAVPEPPVQI